jgi:predicted nuclease of predicted toxin-antitoxin system
LKIQVDENLPVAIADDLRAMGHDADTVDAERLSWADDPTVIAAATAAGRALLTLDKGLADVRTYPPANYAGIILLRPTTAGRNMVVRFVRDHLPHLPDIDPRGRLIVISEAGVRIR